MKKEANLMRERSDDDESLGKKIKSKKIHIIVFTLTQVNFTIN